VILVTGGAGFIGGHIVHRLRAQNRPVRCLVRTPRKARNLEAWGCELVQADVTDAASLRRAVEGAERVIHLVAIRQGRARDFERIMTQGTRDLLAAAGGAGVGRFIHMSALGTSEESKDLVPYYRAKWDSEQAVRSSGLEHVIFRPSFVFARDGGILPTFLRLAKLAPVTPIIGSGEQRIQPIWIDDLVSYFVLALDRPEAANRTFELGGPDVVSWNEFWALLKQTLGNRRPTAHVPVRLAWLNALITERLPGNIPLTRDLLKMLEGPDNVVSSDDGVQTFGLTLLPLREQLRRAV
jgi:NADH dehydrogenase